MSVSKPESNQANLKLSHIESRSMNMNFKPHEVVRQIQQVHDGFNPKSDGSWPLRSMRDIMLDYMRVLKRTYPELSMVECTHLVRLMMFEADGFIVVLCWFYSGFIVV